MISISDRVTVPQIFFHNTHIGGGAELKEIHQSQKLHEILQKACQDTSELDKRLAPPIGDPIEENEQQIDPELICGDCSATLLVGDKTLTHEELRNFLIKNVPVKDSRYKFPCTFQKQTFLGSEIVSVLHKNFGFQNRKEAELFVVELAKLRFFNILDAKDDIQFKMDSDIVCRFPQHENIYVKLMIFQRKKKIIHFSNFQKIFFINRKTQDFTYIINHFKNIVKDDKNNSESIIEKNPIGFLKNLKNQFEKIKESYTLQNSKVDYKKMAEHKDYNRFQEGFAEIQKIDFLQMNENTKKAFCINLYNLMIRVAYVQIGAPGGMWARQRFFTNIQIDIGGNLYTFNDLENGILRANRSAPYSSSRQFADKDPRTKFSMQSADPRIHFALNCGASSCPPVKNFTAEAIDEELRLASQGFCEDNLNVEIKNNGIKGSKIFDWYKADFGAGDGYKFSLQLRDYLRGTKLQALEQLIDKFEKKQINKIKLEFFDYDWSNDAL